MGWRTVPGLPSRLRLQDPFLSFADGIDGNGIGRSSAPVTNLRILRFLVITDRVNARIYARSLSLASKAASTSSAPSWPPFLVAGQGQGSLLVLKGLLGHPRAEVEEVKVGVEVKEVEGVEGLGGVEVEEEVVVEAEEGKEVELVGAEVEEGVEEDLEVEKLLNRNSRLWSRW